MPDQGSDDQQLEVRKDGYWDCQRLMLAFTIIVMIVGVIACAILALLLMMSPPTIE